MLKATQKKGMPEKKKPIQLYLSNLTYDNTFPQKKKFKKNIWPNQIM
jgi:hypothetical protein